MDFPDELSFLSEFGLEPVDADANMAYCKYAKTDPVKALSIEISFNAVQNSFQVLLKGNEEEFASFSSEAVQKIEIFRNNEIAGLRVLFHIHGIASEALIRLEPYIHCQWCLIEN